MSIDIQSALELTARIVIGSMFLEAAIMNIPVFDRLTAHVASRGVPWARVAMIAATLVQAVAAVLVIFGALLTWATLALMAFTVAATFLFHNYWDMDGELRATKRLTFRGNVIILGGLFALLALSV